MDSISFLSNTLNSYMGQSGIYAQNASLSGVDGEVAHSANLVSRGQQGVSLEKEMVNFNWVAELARNQSGENYWYNQKVNDALTAFISNFGTKDSEGTIAHICETFVESFNQLANSPDANKKSQAITNFQNALASLKNLQTTVTNQRQAIVSNEAQIVNRANELITLIASVNYPTRTAEQETSLAKYTNELSQLIDIQVQFQNDNLKSGQAVIYAANSSNAKLIDGANVMGTLQYAAAASTQPGQAIGAINVVSSFGTTQNIRPLITGGMLGGYTAANQKLVDINSVLDQFALQFTNTLNQVHNAGTSGLAAPATLSGSTGCFGAEGTALTGAETITGQGLWRVAVTDTAGKIVDYMDIDLSTVTTVTGLITAANTGTLRIANTPNNLFTVSIATNGGLSITCNNPAANRISLGSGQDNGGVLRPDQLCLGGAFNAATATNVSHFFHLNDLITRSGVAPGSTNGLFSGLNINQALITNPNALAGAILNQQYNLTTSNFAYGAFDRQNFDSLYQALTLTNINFPAVGEFSATQMNLRSYAVGISSHYISAKQVSDETTNTANSIYQQAILQAGKLSGKTTPEEEFKKLTEVNRLIRAIEACLAKSMEMESFTLETLLLRAH